MIECVSALESDHSTRAACAMTGLSRATLYRRRTNRPESSSENDPATTMAAKPRRRPQPSALSVQERALIVEYATSREFVDKSPQQMFYTLLERGIYVASPRTIYRVLAGQGLVGDRRPHTSHPARVVPHLHATAPGDVASWDITAVRTPRRGQYFYAYVMLDVFSRFMPAAALHHTQSEAHARPFVQACIAGFGGMIPKVVHSDNGAPMIAGTMSELYQTLGITRSLSRPRVSNDNPYSESVFKTLKYAPAYPDYFENLGEAQRYFDDFRAYYNNCHYHSGLNYYTPASVFNGTWDTIQKTRQAVLDGAYAARPDRFSRRPRVPAPPTEAWINQAARTITTTPEAAPTAS